MAARGGSVGNGIHDVPEIKMKEESVGHDRGRWK
jgi:hypothetical protein